MYPHTIHADPRTRVPAATFNDPLIHERITPEAEQDFAVPKFASEQTSRLFEERSRYRHDGASLDLLMMAADWLV